ncbi:unnamed protein product, partial [Tetraodon nigroviridis]
IAAAYGAIIVVGLVGNVTLMKTCLSVRSLRTVPNLFLSSLALGDLLLLVTCAPVDASRYLLDEWLFGRVGCKLIPLVQLTSVGVSVFTLTALSADRRFETVTELSFSPRPRQTSAERHSSIRISKGTKPSSSLWTATGPAPGAASVCGCRPSGCSRGLWPSLKPSTRTCTPSPPAAPTRPSSPALPTTGLGSCTPESTPPPSSSSSTSSRCSSSPFYYCFIAQSLRSSVDIQAEGHLYLQRQIRSRKRLAKTVLVFVGLFAVCWLPSHVIYLYRSFHYDRVDTSLGHFIASVCARILAFTNSCVNPFALFLMSKTFRRHFRQQLLCC